MVWNPVQKLGSQPSMPRCLLEREIVDEARDSVRAGADCGTPLLDPSAVQGDIVEEVMLGSGQPCRRDQRAGFERRPVTGEAVDDVFDKLLRESHFSDVVRDLSKGNPQRESTYEVNGEVAGSADLTPICDVAMNGRPAFTPTPEIRRPPIRPRPRCVVHSRLVYVLR